MEPVLSAESHAKEFVALLLGTDPTAYDKQSQLYSILKGRFEVALAQEENHWLPKWYALDSVCKLSQRESVDVQVKTLRDLQQILREDYPVDVPLDVPIDRTHREALTEAEEACRRGMANPDRQGIMKVLDEVTLRVIYRARSYWEGIGQTTFEILTLGLSKPHDQLPSDFLQLTISAAKKTAAASAAGAQSARESSADSSPGTGS